MHRADTLKKQVSIRKKFDGFVEYPVILDQDLSEAQGRIGENSRVLPPPVDIDAAGALPGVVTRERSMEGSPGSPTSAMGSPVPGSVRRKKTKSIKETATADVGEVGCPVFLNPHSRPASISSGKKMSRNNN